MEKTKEKGCEICGIKENCNNFKLGIKQGRKEAIEIIIKLLRIKSLCRIRGLSVDVDTQINKEFFRGAKIEYEELFKHLSELKYIIADIECAKKYLTDKEKLEFEELKQKLQEKK